MAIPASIRPRLAPSTGCSLGATRRDGSCGDRTPSGRRTAGSTRAADGLRGSFFALLAATALLAGCGQRGPLYLPDQPPPKKRFAPAAQDERQIRTAALAVPAVLVAAPAVLVSPLPFEAAGSAERPTRNRS